MVTQKEVLDWVKERWPDLATPEWRAVKLGEESGEVLGAVIKQAVGQKTVDDIRVETAQLIICAKALAESVGFDLDEAVEEEWKISQSRVWPTDAGSFLPGLEDFE